MGQILEGYSSCDLKFEQSKSIGFRKHQQGTPLDCFHKKGFRQNLGMGAGLGTKTILEKAMTGV